VDRVEGAVAEDRAADARNAQPVAYVLAGLRRGEGTQMPPDGDALAQLAQLDGAQLLVELRLA
jgi:hypothetical protein